MRLLPKKRLLWLKQSEPVVNYSKLSQPCGSFVTIEGVEPTNNAAERAIRPALLWRRTSFATQSAGGSIFGARMLTVVTT